MKQDRIVNKSSLNEQDNSHLTNLLALQPQPPPSSKQKHSKTRGNNPNLRNIPVNVSDFVNNQPPMDQNQMSMQYQPQQRRNEIQIEMGQTALDSSLASQGMGGLKESKNGSNAAKKSTQWPNQFFSQVKQSNLNQQSLGASGMEIHHQKALTMANIQKNSSFLIGSPNNQDAQMLQTNSGQVTQKGSQQNQKKGSQNVQLQQQISGSTHSRGRSSGAVFQQRPDVFNQTLVNPSQFLYNQQEMSKQLKAIHKDAELKQMMQMTQGLPINTLSQFTGGNSGSGFMTTQQMGSGNNPFRKQKQQTKQEKYQQQLQMYQSSNPIQKQNSLTRHSRGRQQQTIEPQLADQHQMILQNQIQLVNSQTIHSNQNIHPQLAANNQRSFSNCSGVGTQPNGLSNQVKSKNYQTTLNQTGHRKAPSSNKVLKKSQIQNNLNNSNVVQQTAGLIHMPNIVNNLGSIAMTHQNLPSHTQMAPPPAINSKSDEDITDEQIAQSEEYFERARTHLANLEYKEAHRLFSQSYLTNKTNFDALFYRGVTSLDSGQPEKAIQDLELLAKVCSDYRKTMFIVLSIAYRRVDDYLSANRALTRAIQKYPQYIEAYIARGQIQLYQKKLEKALADFKTVIQFQPLNALALIGIGDTYKQLGKIEEAIGAYSQLVESETQESTKALVRRGLTLLEAKRNEEALSDFNKLTQIAEQSDGQNKGVSLSTAYFYKAKALKKMNNYSDSVLYFEQVLRLGDDSFMSGSALYEIAKIKIQQKDFYEAYYNLQRCVHLDLRQRKLLNYKLFTEGVIFLMKRKTKTGVKLLSKVIDRMKGSGNLGGGKIRTEEENEDQTNRSVVSEHTEDEQDDQDMEKAALQLSGDCSDYIFPLLFIYRAYGYIILEEYENALKDFVKCAQIKKLNNSQHYNMVVCQGLKHLEQNQFEQAISFFTNCAQSHVQKRDPYLLRAITIVNFTLSKSLKPSTRNQMLRDARKDLNTALERSPKDEQVLFLRGILNFALHRFYDSIADLDRVIEKVDETNAAHYLARGRCYACLSMFKEAITDLSIAININKDLLDAYLNRGKCAYLIGDTGLAFMDFQKLIVLEPKNPTVHIYAGNLLMTTGSYEDATKAFTNADNIEKSPLALYQRSRCHVALNNMQEALGDLNSVLDIAGGDKVAIQDRDCLSALKVCSQLEGEKHRLVDKQVFQKSVQAITKLISQERNETMSKQIHESSILHNHSQMIPSAHRTKIDKIRAIRRRKDQDRVQRENPEGGRKNDLRFRVQNQEEEGEEVDEFEDISELDDREIEKLNRKLARDDSEDLDQPSSEEEEEQEANYYKENIFNREDFYLYRGVLSIYAGDLTKAISDLEQCSAIMHQNKVLYPKNQFPDDDLDGYESPTGLGNVNGQKDVENESNASSQTDLSDVGLCSLNIHEFSFNIVLCLLLKRDFETALSKLDYILDTIAKKYANQLWLIRGIVKSVLGLQDQARRDFARAMKYDKVSATQFLKQKKDVYLDIFPQQQRLCSFFQYIRVEFPQFEASPACLYLKPSFSFPFIKPPNMIPCVDQGGVLQVFKLKKSGVTVKPDAPWIKKCSFGIKFTEEILYTDDDREPTPDEEKEYKKRKQRQQERAMEGAGFIRAHTEKVKLRTNIFVEETKQEEEEQNLYNQEEVNAIDLQELADLGQIGNLQELGDLQNLEGLEETLAQQMKLLRNMKEEGVEVVRGGKPGHKRNKTSLHGR